jgi:hypothetical protein
MIALSLLIIAVKQKRPNARIRSAGLWLLISGSLVFILACVWDYGAFVISNYGWSGLYTLEKDALFAVNRQYTPQAFNWWLFGLAMLLIWLGIGSFGWQHRASLKRG